MSGNDKRRADARQEGKPTEARGIFRRGARFLVGPGGLVAWNEIGDGARLIRSLVEDIKSARAARRKIRFNEDGTFDLVAMAFDASLPLSEIERRLDNRQIQTARNTMLYLGLGVFLLAIWVMAILLHGAIVATGINTLVFLGVILIIFVLSFTNAFNNWQVRTRRLGTLREFVHFDGSWWPRMR
jgi:hypothetical protein